MQKAGWVCSACGLSAHSCCCMQDLPNLAEIWKHHFVGFCRISVFVICLHIAGSLSDKLLRLLSRAENYLFYKKTLLCRGGYGLSYLPNCVFLSPSFIFSASVLETFAMVKYALILTTSLRPFLHFHTLYLSSPSSCYSRSQFGFTSMRGIPGSACAFKAGWIESSLLPKYKP